MQSASAGFFLGLSLILAIGAQNAFVLRQGLRGEHVFWVALTCAVSDALLITFGVSSFGWIERTLPLVTPVFLYGGVAFLVWYGFEKMRAAWRGGEALTVEGNGGQSLRKALLTCLALTWLNPHVYLDTVVFLGSVSTQYDSALAFGAGAAVSSFVFFFSLAYGARLLRPLFSKPLAWRILDFVIALVMWGIAAKLLMQ